VKKHGWHWDVVGVVWSYEKVVDCGETDWRWGLLGGAHRQDRRHVLRRARASGRAVFYSPDSATVHLASMPWYGNGRRPVCAGAQAKDPRAKRGGGTMQYKDAAHVPRRSARRGTGGPDLEAVGNESARTLSQARLPVRRAAKPAERPARRRRSGARPSSISAGQRDFDCVFLQKV
jgi:hypothetical protein